jgi:LemA protein
MENYPQLKSLDSVKDLMVSLEGTENRISVARQRFNETVKIYNQNLQTFPTNIIGGMFGFVQMPRFESVVDAKVAPVVNFEK